jgi:hypothetical protein
MVGRRVPNSPEPKTAAAAWLPNGVRIVKEQLVIILEAIRAAQCTLGRCRQPNVTVEQLRDILCSAGVNRAVRALAYEEASPPTVPEDGFFPHDVAAC